MRGRYCGLAAPLLLLGGTAEAQSGDMNATFSLKPGPLRPISRTLNDRNMRSRFYRLEKVLVDDRSHEMTMVFRRKKQRFSGDRLGGRDEPVSTDVVPQSRMVLMTFEDRIPLTAQLTARAGFQGMKLSNRVANATSLDNDERLRMRDWFMPRATVIWSPKANVDLMIDYRESLTGYGETGRTGPMAMTREEFRAWSRNFRPERHSRLRFDAEWRPSTDLDLAVTAFQGRIDNRMLFIDRGYLPVNGGSANLQGATISIRHRLSSRWHWSMRYGATQLNRTEGGRATEQGMTVQAGWSSGPWSASLSGTRSSQAALLHEAAGSRGPMHIEGALRYEIAGFDRMPLNVSLRLTDLSQLAGDKLLRHDLSGIAPATDHARGLMLNVGCSW